MGLAWNDVAAEKRPNARAFEFYIYRSWLACHFLLPRVHAWDTQYPLNADGFPVPTNPQFPFDSGRFGMKFPPSP